MYALDIDCSTHKFVLQYLFLNRINESLSEWVNIWNNHKLRLPHGQSYMDPSTYTVKRSIVPDQVMRNAKVNFGQYSNLYKLADEETNNFLFEVTDDMELDEQSLELSTANFQLSNEKFILLQQYEPLTLFDSMDECIHRYVTCIMDMYDIGI